MTRKTRLTLAALTIGLICPSLASAGETIKYIYDARGRLVEVKREPTSTVNTNVQTCYKYDLAGNRVKVTTTTTSPVPACPA